MRVRDEILGVRESPMVQIATVAENTPGSLKLCYGESDVPTPEFICRAATEAMAAGHTFYTHTAGYWELRQAIAAKVFELHHVRYEPSEIMCTVGATAALFTAIRAFIGPGDNAVVITPAYPLFSNAVTLVGGESRAVPLGRSERRFALDLDRVRHAIDHRTRMVIVNSPSNPTGWVISVDEQRALCELAEQHDLVILADEVYERLVYDAPLAPSFARVAHSKNRVIVVNSFSKSYNMTGWRLGWVQATEDIVRVMYKAAEFITSNPSSMVQQAGIVALRDGETYLADLRAHYVKRRVQVQAALHAIPGVSLFEPDGAFYAFFRIDGITDDSTAFTARLVREAGVALCPGVAFGAAGEGSVRLCFAAQEATIIEALSRMDAFLRSETKTPQ